MKLLLGLPEFTSGFDANVRSWPFGRLPAAPCSGNRPRALAHDRRPSGAEERAHGRQPRALSPFPIESVATRAAGRRRPACEPARADPVPPIRTRAPTSG
ncbi:hypothetical protein DF141_25385 [Burkholderia cenocepacia]|nr:hypothetical protein DF141_25385 [Burkholderia cenocepacia]RQZ93385.1 hypothetical protein DF058_18590 [Burkholderia cenocepacia]RRA10387.1 hypothetical protein DF059_25340 [Burkholderia cenocepacia]